MSATILAIRYGDFRKAAILADFLFKASASSSLKAALSLNRAKASSMVSLSIKNVQIGSQVNRNTTILVPSAHFSVCNPHRQPSGLSVPTALASSVLCDLQRETKTRSTDLMHMENEDDGCLQSREDSD